MLLKDYDSSCQIFTIGSHAEQVMETACARCKCKLVIDRAALPDGPAMALCRECADGHMLTVLSQSSK